MVGETFCKQASLTAPLARTASKWPFYPDCQDRSCSGICSPSLLQLVRSSLCLPDQFLLPLKWCLLHFRKGLLPDIPQVLPSWPLSAPWAPRSTWAEGSTVVSPASTAEGLTACKHPVSVCRAGARVKNNSICLTCFEDKNGSFLIPSSVEYISQQRILTILLFSK